MIPDSSIWFIETHAEKYTIHGGGVCIDGRGYIITVAHIVPPSHRMFIGRTHADELMPLKLIKVSPNLDLALLEVEDTDNKIFSFVPLVDIPVEIDERIFAYIHQSDLVYTKKEGITSYPFPCGEENLFPDLEDKSTVLSQRLTRNDSRNLDWEPFRTVSSIVDMHDTAFYDYHPQLPLIQVKGFGEGLGDDSGLSGCPAFLRRNNGFIGIFTLSKQHFQYVIPVHFLRIYATRFVPLHPLPLPRVITEKFSVDDVKSSAVRDSDEIAKLFPCLFGQPSSIMLPSESEGLSSAQKLKIGVVLSGGQAPGGHHVIWGIFDYLQARAKGSTIYGFRDGPAGIMKCKYVELTSYFLHPYRNQGGLDMICSGTDKIETPEQFKQAEDTAVKLDLYGLVVIGGDDSNTNACLLAENFRSKNLKTRVIGCPNTIDGDHQSKEVPTSFGFNTARKIYAERIEDVMIDARSTGKYYHFVRLMGRAASHITLECALQTRPNISLIGEEVFAKKQTLKNVTDYMVDIICKRAESGFNYGVILIPEGLIDFIPEVEKLIAELNEILAHEVVVEAGLWKKKLTTHSVELFDLLPQTIQDQLMLERDPHGNVQVSKIETEKMLMQMVETELEKRREQGSYKGEFKGQSHFFEFFGNEGRCGLLANFDSSYYYALGYAAGALLHAGKTGLISSVGNLAASVEEWNVGGTALTSLMDVERRHGKFKAVIKKPMVELEGAAFKEFASMRDKWALNS